MYSSDAITEHNGVHKHIHIKYFCHGHRNEGLPNFKNEYKKSHRNDQKYINLSVYFITLIRKRRSFC